MVEFGGTSQRAVDRFAFVHVWLGSMPNKEAFWDYLEQDDLPGGTFSAFMNDIGVQARYDDELMVFGGCICSKSHTVADLFDDTIVDESERQTVIDRCVELGIMKVNAFICYQDPDLNPPDKDYRGLRYLGQFKVRRMPKTRQY